MPCVGLLSADELLEGLRPYHIQPVINGLGGSAAARQRQHERQAACAKTQGRAADDSEVAHRWFAPAGSTPTSAWVEPSTMARAFGEQLRAALAPPVVSFHERGGVVEGTLDIGGSQSLHARFMRWCAGLPSVQLYSCTLAWPPCAMRNIVCGCLCAAGNWRSLASGGSA